MKTRILCILDGFGFGVNSINNAIANAKMPNLRRIMSQYYWTTLDADGEAVGQEAGLVGNSEVGHMNIGGLQLVPQLSYQITKSAGKGFDLVTKDQVFNPREYLQSKFKNSNNKTVHLIGLFSTGTIHSDMRHWIGSIEAAGKAGADKIVLHLISDGRDSDCKSLVATWQEFVTKFENRLQQFEDKIFLGSVGGRFYAMDRDKNWERTVKGILPMFEYKIFDEQDQGKNVPFQEFFDKKYNVKNEHKESKETHFLFNTEDREDIIKKGLLKTGLKWILEYYTQKQYDENIFDENIEPSSFYYIKPQENTKTFNLIQKGDTLWLINHRSDRMKQLTQMICEINQEFDLNLDILSMNDYGIGREYPVSLAATPFKKGELVENSYKPIFKTQKVQNTLAQTIAKQGQTQLHIAETEKYAHVTYFLNGGSQEKHEGETWELIPSNKVNSHAEQPEMKAKEITDYILDHGIGEYDFIIVNFANPDMVAHTGLIPESIASLEFLDLQLGRLIDEVEQSGHSIIITADHGNCEFVGGYTKKVFSFSQELNKQIETIQNLTDTEHNPNPVPCIIVDERFKKKEFRQSDFITSIQKFSKNNNLNVDSNLFKKALEQDNRNLINNQNWLTQDQINELKKDQLPLWYVGVLFLSI